VTDVPRYGFAERAVLNKCDTARMAVQDAHGRGRGILRRRTAQGRFHVDRRTPADDLAWVVDYVWVLTWDLRGQDPHRQQVLSRPTVNMTFTTGGRARVVGVVRGVFTETIEGRGRAIGMCFQHGGFRPYLDGPVSAITDRFVPVTEIFGASARTVADAIIAEPDDDAAVALAEDFLRSRTSSRPDPAVAEVGAIVARIAADPALLRVDELTAESGIGARRLQRLFAEYVGVGPKWVIRRYRMQEAAERAGTGTDVDWAALSAELGYADQAHFTRDFSRVIGVSPGQYARESG
jgi:AraC-like DNA-binding protein